MITFGFNTLAMLTWGLGIRMTLIPPSILRKPAVIEFRDKPAGIAVEERTAATSFGDILMGFGDKEIGFKDL